MSMAAGNAATLPLLVAQQQSQHAQRDEVGTQAREEGDVGVVKNELDTTSPVTGSEPGVSAAATGKPEADLPAAHGASVTHADSVVQQSTHGVVQEQEEVDAAAAAAAAEAEAVTESLVQAISNNHDSAAVAAVASVSAPNSGIDDAKLNTTPPASAPVGEVLDDPSGAFLVGIAGLSGAEERRKTYVPPEGHRVAVLNRRGVSLLHRAGVLIEDVESSIRTWVCLLCESPKLIKCTKNTSAASTHLRFRHDIESLPPRGAARRRRHTIGGAIPEQNKESALGSSTYGSTAAPMAAGFQSQKQTGHPYSRVKREAPSGNDGSSMEVPFKRRREDDGVTADASGAGVADHPESRAHGFPSVGARASFGLDPLDPSSSAALPTSPIAHPHVSVPSASGPAPIGEHRISHMGCCGADGIATARTGLSCVQMFSAIASLHLCVALWDCTACAGRVLIVRARGVGPDWEVRSLCLGAAHVAVGKSVQTVLKDVLATHDVTEGSVASVTVNECLRRELGKEGVLLEGVRNQACVRDALANSVRDVFCREKYFIVEEDEQGEEGASANSTSGSLRSFLRESASALANSQSHQNLQSKPQQVNVTEMSTATASLLAFGYRLADGTGGCAGEQPRWLAVASAIGAASRAVAEGPLLEQLASMHNLLAPVVRLADSAKEHGGGRSHIELTLALAKGVLSVGGNVDVQQPRAIMRMRDELTNSVSALSQSTKLDGTLSADSWREHASMPLFAVALHPALRQLSHLGASGQQDIDNIWNAITQMCYAAEAATNATRAYCKEQSGKDTNGDNQACEKTPSAEDVLVSLGWAHSTEEVVTPAASGTATADGTGAESVGDGNEGTAKMSDDSCLEEEVSKFRYARPESLRVVPLDGALEWWRENGRNYPRLAHVARAVLGCPATCGSEPNTPARLLGVCPHLP